MSLPSLLLVPAHRSDLLQYFEEMMASVPRYLDLRDAAEGDDLAAAQRVADRLSGVVHSSDTDVEYYPCVLETEDPAADSFFAALGIARDARASVSGWDNPKLECVQAGDGDGHRSTLALLTRLSDDELQNLSDYVTEEDVAALKAAGDELAAIGPIVGIQLCTDDGASKLCMTVARRAPGVHVGVLTVRIET